MKIKLATVNLQVRDALKSRRFYIDVLGMVEDERRSHPPDFVFLRSDQCAITLATFREGREPIASPSIELGFETDDIEKMRSHLDALGISDYQPQTMGWGKALELTDPDGHRAIVYSFASE